MNKVLLAPAEVKAAFNKKEAENYAFRTYLKIHAKMAKLDKQ